MQRMFVRSFSLTVLALLGLFAFASAQTPAASKYTITNLDSNVTGQGLFTDPLLVNAWGLAYAPTGAFWISFRRYRLVNSIRRLWKSSDFAGNSPTRQRHRPRLSSWNRV